MGAGLRSRQIDARPSRGSRVARGAVHAHACTWGPCEPGMRWDDMWTAWDGMRVPRRRTCRGGGGGGSAQHKCTVLNNRQVRLHKWVRLLSSAKSFVYAIIALCVDVCARFACSMQACSGLGSRQQAGDMRRGTRRLNLLFSLSSLSDVNCLKSSILGEREGGGRGGRG